MADDLDREQDSELQSGELQSGELQSTRVGRRDFVGLSVAAGIAVTTAGTASAALEVVEKDVDLKTPDGTCDAAFIHPKSGSHAGVISGPTLSACVLRCARWASALPPRAIRCWCRILFIE
jgi:hypothetical protein